MSLRKLEKNEWETYFDNVSRHLKAATAEIEVAGLNLGDQVEAEWVPLVGIAYDPKDDLVEVATETVDHLVRHPSAIYVDDGTGGLHSVEITDDEGNQHIVRLKAPLALPEP